MPTYSYACTACDHRFDIYQEFTDDSLTVCPDCEGRLRKVFGSVGVTFKGSGFYRTDHGLSNAATAKSEGKSETAAKTESTKPSGKTESSSSTTQSA